MTRSVLTLVMFATVSASAMAQSTAPDTVDEPRSGTPFPLSLTPPGGTTPHWLMGTAIRKRTLFRVQIYAFGLYVDPEGARASLSRFAGVSAPRLEDDESFYRHLLDLDFDMTLRLVMTRTVDGDDVAEAFRAVSTSLRQSDSAFTVATPRHRRGAPTTDRAAAAVGQ